LCLLVEAVGGTAVTLNLSYTDKRAEKFRKRKTTRTDATFYAFLLWAGHPTTA
jgi:hypothetical protein